MRKITAFTALFMITIIVFSGGCIGHGKDKTTTTTLEITKTVTKTKIETSPVYYTQTISTYYITTLYSTQFETLTIPVTTTIIISGTNTSTVVNSNGEETTIVKYTAVYTYQNVPFLAYSIDNNTKIVTIPTTFSSIIAPIIDYLHNSIEGKYTSYRPLADYIGDFSPLRLKLIMKNFSDVDSEIAFTDVYYSHQYNSIYGPLIYAAYALNSHTPVSILLAVQNNTIIDAFAGFNNKYYSKDRIMGFDALEYSWFTHYGNYTMIILALDKNAIVTQLNTQKITAIPSAFTSFESLINKPHYGIQFLITSNSMTEVRSYQADIGRHVATAITAISTHTETTIYSLKGNALIAMTIKPTTINNATTTVTITNNYFAPTYYGGVDVLGFYPQGGADYNAYVISNLILYTVYQAHNNTLTVMEYTIKDTAIVNATYYEVAIGNNTVATGTIAGWIN